MPANDDDFDLSGAWDQLDESDMHELEECETRRVSNAPPRAGPLKQMDLFGNAIQAGPSRVNGGASVDAFPAPSSSNERVNAIVKKDKKWDRTAFAKSAATKRKASDNKGKGNAKAKGKGKARARNTYSDDDDEGDFEEDEEAYDPLVFDEQEAAAPPKPMKLQPDREACKTYVYPLNKPLRNYQYNIVQKALYTDTLVALPTGLGKTFLAAVIMYNFYRWFPKGKIIFMAPSRPLVTQQISACHGIVGIPLRDAVEMTGKDAPDKRTEEWAKRRVFYCTPQTVKNDLYAKRLDPSDVICLVVDEAHRATGDYAYTEVVRYMMQKNPHFRLLALTATPGGDAQVVQNVIDALHIGSIEVRTDESIDIRQYIHSKKVDLITIPVQGEIGSIRSRFGSLMEILLRQVKDYIRTNKSDPTTIHPYVFRSAFGQLKGKGGHLYAVMAGLGSMAQAIAKLLEQSVSSFHEELKKLQTELKGKAKEVLQHPNFAAIMSDTHDIVNGRDFEGHPKMVKLRELVLDHFERAKRDGSLDTTRIMVFCSFREVVEEIVLRLNQSKEIRATRLVGQGTDAKGKKGLAQKEQNRVLAEFKKGVHNVLVATSIGEEGLDIGELDLIICYEAPKSAIRTLQRAGRTGRARDGRVVVLMTEGIEEHNWKKANEKYKDVQNAIVSGKLFELYADCQRLIPADIKPIADKVSLVIEPFDPEKMGIGTRRSTSSTKRKRDETDNLDLFAAGFQKASSGLKKPAGGSKAKKGVDLPEEVEQFPIGHIGPSSLAPAEREDIARRREQPSIQAAQPAVTRRAAFPRPLPKTSLIPTDSPRRSLSTASTRREAITDILKQGAQHAADPGAFEKWESKLRSDLRWEHVHKWKYAEADLGKGKDKSFLASSFRIPEEDRMSASNSAAANATRSKQAVDGSKKPDTDADLLFSDEDDVAAVQLGRKASLNEAEDVSDTELPDLSAIAVPRKKLKKAKTSHLPPAPLRPPVTNGAAPIKQQSSVASRPKSKATTKSTTARETLKVPSLAHRPNAAVIEIESDDEDPSLMLVDKPVQAKPDGETARKEPAVPARKAKKQQAEPSKPAPAMDAIDSDELYDELDLDEMEEMEVLTASASPRKARLADEIVPATSPGVPALEQDEPSRTGAPSRPLADKPSSSIFASHPIVVQPVANKRRRVVETSSPDKEAAKLAAARVPVVVAPKPADDSDVVLLATTQPRPKGRLIKAGLAADPKAILKSKKSKRTKLAADGCPFFDLRAENSDDPDSATDPEDDYGGAENTVDRQFVDSKDITDPSDMSRFYRESLMTQVNSKFQQGVHRPGQFKMRVDASKRYVAPRRDEEQIEASQYSNDSFCAGDDEDIVYDDQTDGLPDEFTSEGQ